MPYVTPTVETFKVRFPEFAPVNDALVGMVLNEAIDAVGETWLERDRAIAQMYLAAHKLAMMGEPQRTTGIGVGNSPTTGAVKRRKVGDVETEFAGVSSGGSGSSYGGFGGTSYGLEYWRLLKMNFPSPMVV